MAESLDWAFIVGHEGDWSIGYVPNLKNGKGRVVSGTTIVSGFDLGQHDERDIRGLRLSPGLTEKLLPFARHRGPSAVMAVQRSFEGALTALIRLNNRQAGTSGSADIGQMQPIGVIGDTHGPLRAARPHEKPTQFIAPGETVLRLELNPGEVRELTQAARRSYYDQLAGHYDLATKGTRFSMLPSDVQTALLSLHWHSGNIWSQQHKGREIFDAAVQQDWVEAIDCLRAGKMFSDPNNYAFRKRRRAEAARIAKGMKIDPTQIGPRERARLQRQEHLQRVIEIGRRNARIA